jgi:dephospho-CoA kinase
MRPSLIGITGGIGSGKTTVCRIFEILEVPVYYADARAKMLMVENEELRQRITDIFGEESYQNGQLNRKHIAGIAFHEPGKLEELNKWIHPAVAEDFKEWSKNQSKPYVLKEAALLFEAGSYKSLDKVITVTSPYSLRKTRILLRDPHREEADVEAIMAKQWTDKEKVSLSDFEIVNDEISSVLDQVLKIHASLIPD